jgi:hypothetical protein
VHCEFIPRGQRVNQEFWLIILLCVQESMLKEQPELFVVMQLVSLL